MCSPTSPSPSSAATAARKSGVSAVRASGRLTRATAAKQVPRRVIDESLPAPVKDSDAQLPDDTPYRGRVGPSRVKIDPANVDGSKKRTARMSTGGKRPNYSTSDTSSPSKALTSSDAIDPVSSPSQPATTPAPQDPGPKPSGSKTRTVRGGSRARGGARSGRKRVVSAETVVDETPPPASTSEPSASLEQDVVLKGKKRLLSPAPIDEPSSSTLRITRSRHAKKHRVSSPEPEVPADPVPDAVEMDVDNQLTDGDEGSIAGKDLSQYDLEDPFIDDSAIEDNGQDEEDDVSLEEGELADDSEGTDDVIEAANTAADEDVGHRDPAELVQEQRSEDRRRRIERTIVQIGLDESLARDEQSEEEEKITQAAIKASTSTSRTFAAPTPPSTPSKSGRNSDPTTPAPSVALSSAFTPRTRGRAFRDMLDSPSGPSGASGSGGVTLEDLHTHRVRSLPESCEVTDVNLQDPQLRKYYEGLPPLKAGALESWSDAEGPGMVMFSRWVEMCSNMSFDTCLNALEFRQVGNFINPCRISPLDVRVHELIGSRPKFHLYTPSRKPAICVSPVLCVDSHLLAPPERGLKQKWVSGIFHSQEWERFVGFMTTVFGHERMNAQLSKDAIQFTTKASFIRAQGASGGSDRMSCMFTNVKSPSIKGKAKAVSADTFSLDFEDVVPVYDAREVELDLQKDISHIHLLPQFEDEVPRGSFVIVAYTVAVFKAEKTRAWTISLNIHWAVLVGTPDDN